MPSLISINGKLYDINDDNIPAVSLTTEVQNKITIAKAESNRQSRKK